MSKTKSRFFVLFLFIVFFISPLFSFAQSTDLATLVQQLQQQVLELQKRIQTLQQQLSETRSELGVQQTPVIKIEAEDDDEENEDRKEIPEFTKTLSRGSSGDDVRKLQEFLKKDKAIYPDGLITGYFGPKTEEALKRWQKKHNIEQVGILGPQTRARFQELGRGVIQGLLQQGAGASGVIPPGLFTAPGIQKKLEEATSTQATTTSQSQEDLCPKDPSKCYTEKTCKSQNYYWYTVSCHKESPRSGTCAEANTFCINSDECSKGGYYWCRNSCYATSTACLGQIFVPPVQPVIPATPTVPATPAVSAIVATSTTTGDTTPPSIPTGLTTTPAKYSITLSWNNSTDNVGVAGYKVYRNGTQVVSTTTSTSLTTSSFTDWVLTPSTSYSYTVAAYDAAGNVSAQSSAVLATTLAAQITVTDTTPPVISNVQSTNITQNSVTITWTTNENSDSQFEYDLETASALIYGQKSSLNSSLTTSHSITISGLSSGTKYQYQVVSKDAAGNAAKANEYYFTTSVPADTTPPILSDVHANATPTSAVITWITNELSDSRVEYGLSTSFDLQTPWDTTLTKNHMVNLIDLHASSYYYFLAESRDASGNFKYYFHNGFSTPSLSAPTGLIATPSGSSDIYLSWNAVAGVRNYRLYRRPVGGTIWTMLTDGYQPTNFTNTAVPAGTYDYKVNACDIASPPHCSTDSNYSSISVTTATTTTNINFDTTSRLAQILESLNNILNSLKLLR